MLYVGHRSDTHPWWRTTFAERLGVTRIAVVDLQAPNLQTAAGFTSELYLGDIRGPDTTPPGFDLVFWDEGPEHVPLDDAAECIRALRARHGRVLISCPWGHQPQGTGPDDPEFHHWAPMPEHFSVLGMESRTFGEMFDGRGKGHGNIIAWTVPPPDVA